MQTNLQTRQPMSLAGRAFFAVARHEIGRDTPFTTAQRYTKDGKLALWGSRVDEALRQFNIAVEIDPSQSGIISRSLLWYGRALRKFGDGKEAMTVLGLSAAYRDGVQAAEITRSAGNADEYAKGVFERAQSVPKYRLVEFIRESAVLRPEMPAKDEIEFIGGLEVVVAANEKIKPAEMLQAIKWLAHEKERAMAGSTMDGNGCPGKFFGLGTLILRAAKRSLGGGFFGIKKKNLEIADELINYVLGRDGRFSKAAINTYVQGIEAALKYPDLDTAAKLREKVVALEVKYHEPENACRMREESYTRMVEKVQLEVARAIEMENSLRTIGNISPGWGGFHSPI
jgi:hypothetical protein